MFFMHYTSKMYGYAASRVLADKMPEAKRGVYYIFSSFFYTKLTETKGDYKAPDPLKPPVKITDKQWALRYKHVNKWTKVSNMPGFQYVHPHL